MTMRKPTRAQEIQTMRDEIETSEAFLKPIEREAKRLLEIEKVRPLTLPEARRVEELLELQKKKNVEIALLNEQIRNFYAPASA